MVKKEQNTSGGDVHSMNEIKLGAATYVVYRSFAEGRSISELIVDRILREKKDNSTFDERDGDTV